MSKLSIARRAALAGYRRAKARARKEMHAMASDYDAALLDLEHRFDELARVHYKQCVDAAISEALLQRAYTSALARRKASMPSTRNDGRVEA